MSVNTSGGCGWIGSALRWISRRFVKCKMGFSTTKKGKNFGRVQMDVMMVEFKEVGKICKSWPARGRCEIWGTLVMRLKRIKLNCSAKSMKIVSNIYINNWSWQNHQLVDQFNLCPEKILLRRASLPEGTVFFMLMLLLLMLILLLNFCSSCYVFAMTPLCCYVVADISPLGLLQMFTPYVAAKHWQGSRDCWRLSTLIGHMQSTDGFWTVITRRS